MHFVCTSEAGARHPPPPTSISWVITSEYVILENEVCDTHRSEMMIAKSVQKWRQERRAYSPGEEENEQAHGFANLDDFIVQTSAKHRANPSKFPAVPFSGI